MSRQVYDAIFAGGGAAGLSLAYWLHRTDPARAMLIIDEDVKDRNDHTWCFWCQTPSYLDSLAYRKWERLAVNSDQERLTLHLTPYRYSMVRSLDFYRFMDAELASSSTTTSAGNVHFLRGCVEAVDDGPDHAEVEVNGQRFRGRWVFDSRYRAAEYQPLTRTYHYLIQHFLGWEIESETSLFDPTLPTLFDFRTPQHGTMRFAYVLPFTEKRGLVEFTLFSECLLSLEEYRSALQQYLESVLEVRTYRVLSEEHGMIPMTDHPMPRRAGRSILNIGTRGGQVKPSTGYAFWRLQKDAIAIVKSLTTQGHPFHLPEPPRRYRIFDAMLLEILQHHGGWGEHIFTQLFRRNPVQRIFRFLDEESGWRENLQLMATVPLRPFVKAWLAVTFLRGIS